MGAQVLKWLSLVLGGIVGLLGGWDILMQVLALMVVADVLVGSFLAAATGTVSVEIAYKGGFKKLGIFIAIAVAVALDRVLSGAVPGQLLRTAACGYYIAVEGLSVATHLVALGVPLPPVLLAALERYRQQQDKS